MINVGCKYGPNDLPPEAWADLIALAEERQWMRTLIDDQRKANKDLPPIDPNAQRELDKVRKEQGIPAPGQSIFANRPLR